MITIRFGEVPDPGMPKATFPIGILDDWWLNEQGLRVEIGYIVETGSSFLRVGKREFVFKEDGELYAEGTAVDTDFYDKEER